MVRRPPRSTQIRSSAASDVYKRQILFVALTLAGQTPLVWLPILLVLYGLWALFTTGVALALSAANVFFHDVQYLWSIVSQLLFYATPVIYFIPLIKLDALRNVANYGPTGSFIVAFHDVLYDLSLIHISEPTRPY